MGAASIRKAFFEGSRLAFRDSPLDLLRQPFTLAACGEIPFQILIPRHFVHALKPAGALPVNYFCRMGSEVGFPSFVTNMTTKLTLDKAGRVMIPKPLRQELHLGPGDTLQLESEGEQITLRPMRPKALLKKERGVWVYQGEPTEASVSAVIDREREKRLREMLG
jgi:AbrB family looped-hinge helix DNA binding protein